MKEDWTPWFFSSAFFVVMVFVTVMWIVAGLQRNEALRALAACQQENAAKAPVCKCESVSTVRHTPIDGQQTLWPKFAAKGLMDIPEGATVYTVPWAMYATEDRRLWLYGDYSYTAERQGTSEMTVRKERGMYLVDITDCDDHRWRIGSGRLPTDTWVPLPVFGIHDENGLTDIVKEATR